jgi:hypothetical protein
MAIFTLSVIGTIAAFSPFDRIQVAAAQQENNNNNTNFFLIYDLNSYRNWSSRYWSYSNSTGLFKDKKAI